MRRDGLLDDALIALGAAAVLDNVVVRWLLGWHRLIDSWDDAIYAQAAFVVVGIDLVILTTRRPVRDCEGARMTWPDRDACVALGVVSGKWVLSVLAELADGPRRYTELQARLPVVAGSMLTGTRRRMERDGIVAREVEPAIPPRVEYRLTELGETLREPLSALSRWAERHVVTPVAVCSSAYPSSLSTSRLRGSVPRSYSRKKSASSKPRSLH